jgi:hypothetical protein
MGSGSPNLEVTTARLDKMRELPPEDYTIEYEVVAVFERVAIATHKTQPRRGGETVGRPKFSPPTAQQRATPRRRPPTA